MKRSLLVSMFVAVLLVQLFSLAASAQDGAAGLGSKGGVALSAERLFGFVHADVTTTAGGMDRTSHLNSFSLLGNSLGLFTVYAQPRVGADFFALDKLSLGASVSYFRVSQSTDTPAGVTTTSPTISGYVLAPRVGYAAALGRFVSVWPRLGFTFAHLGTETTINNGVNGSTTTKNGTDVYAVTIEAPFVFAFAPHAFASVAPMLDLGVGGSTSSTNAVGTTTSTDSKETDYGVLFGLGGFL
jgi:hypothetical protein